MAEWTPPRSEGLSGERYVETDLEQFVDDLSDAHAPGVYALRLSTPSDRETVRERWSAAYDVDVPEWVWIAFESPAVLYIGAAKNVHARLHEHLDSPNRSASICHAFPIHSVWDVWWFDSLERAFERESGIAMDITNQHPGVFVRQA